MATRFQQLGAMGGAGAWPARWVVLRHEEAEGGWHFDWMIEDREHGEAGRQLRTFRMSVRPDQITSEGAACAPLAWHRDVYLEFEGELSGGRGRVTRVAEGVARWVRAGRGADCGNDVEGWRVALEAELDVGRFVWMRKAGAGEPDAWVVAKR